MTLTSIAEEDPNLSFESPYLLLNVLHPCTGSYWPLICIVHPRTSFDYFILFYCVGVSLSQVLKLFGRANVIVSRLYRIFTVSLSPSRETHTVFFVLSSRAWLLRV